jgi:8-oxo-dGTP diphosphatase
VIPTIKRLLSKRWMMRFQYCPSCGKEVEIKNVENKPRAYCPACQNIHYEQLKVGVGALIPKAGKILLIRRATPPFQGLWNLPAGYVEIDECPTAAVCREVQEESGLDVQVVSLSGVYFFDDDPRGNGILIVYTCDIVGGSLMETAEGLTPTFFAPQQLPMDLAGAGHDQAVHDWSVKMTGTLNVG